MADLVDAAKKGNQRVFYQLILENLAETLPDCADYAKPNVVRSILAVQEKLDNLPRDTSESPLAKARAKAKAERDA